MCLLYPDETSEKGDLENNALFYITKIGELIAKLLR